MSLARRLAEVVHLVALGSWLGALGLAVAVATAIFPFMHDLDPSLPDYAAYEGPHWSLLAGKTGFLLFGTLDVAQFAGMVLALGSFIVAAVAGLPRTRWSTLVRAALLLALVGVLSYDLFIFDPRLEQAVRAYWSAAAAGDDAMAANNREVFRALHGRAGALIVTSGVLVLGALVAAAWSITAPAPEREPNP